jgi:hypothetical protein
MAWMGPMFMLVSLNDLAGKLLADRRSARLRAAEILPDLDHGRAKRTCGDCPPDLRHVVDLADGR